MSFGVPIIHWPIGQKAPLEKVEKAVSVNDDVSSGWYEYDQSLLVTSQLTFCPSTTEPVHGF